jgi:hypothetical protein
MRMTKFWLSMALFNSWPIPSVNWKACGVSRRLGDGVDTTESVASYQLHESNYHILTPAPSGGPGSIGYSRIAFVDDDAGGDRLPRRCLR